ncbi:MAG: hypothetical protein Q9166_002830 [cf. Caloplaca sp. 2 TL-2023]
MAASPAPEAPKVPQRRKRPAVHKIAGTVIPFDPEIDLDRPTPTPLFPVYKPSPPAPLTESEKAQVAAFRSFRTRIHEGPFYTILDNDARVGKTAKPSPANFDPFEGMPTYSQKYIKKRRRLPKLSARPYVLKYFPKELWPTLDPKTYRSSSMTNGIEKRIPTRKIKREAAAGEASGDEEDAAEHDPDEEAINEAVDDAFDDDDDDGGDYNAEQYFDDGGDDAGDDLDGDDGDHGQQQNTIYEKYITDGFQ